MLIRDTIDDSLFATKLLKPLKMTEIDYLAVCEVINQLYQK